MLLLLWLLLFWPLLWLLLLLLLCLLPTDTANPRPPPPGASKDTMGAPRADSGQRLRSVSNFVRM